MLPKEKGLAPPKENPVLAEGTKGLVVDFVSGDLIAVVENKDPVEEFAPKLILGAVEKLDRVLELLSVGLIEGVVEKGEEGLLVVLLAPNENPPKDEVGCDLISPPTEGAFAFPLELLIASLVLWISCRCFS